RSSDLFPVLIHILGGVHPLQAEAQATAVRLDAQDAQREHITLADHIARVRHAVIGQLADVDQPFNGGLLDQARKSPEFRQFGDLALDKLPCAIRLCQVIPRVRHDVLAAEADALAFPVDADHLDLDLIPRLEHFLRVVDVPPCQLRQVDQPIRAADVDKRAEIGKAHHAPLADLPDLQFLEQLLTPPCALLLCRCPLGEDQPVATPIHLNNLDADLLTDHAAPAVRWLLAPI